MSGFGALATAIGIPFVAASGGATMASRWSPTKSAQSAIQHFAAGLVFAAAAAELVPDLLKEHHGVAVAIGFALGIAAMLAVRQFGDRMEAKGSQVGLILTVAIDVFLDGILIGIGIAEGGKTGLLLSIALTGELGFLGLAVTSALSTEGVSRRRILTTTIGLAALVIPGGAIGFYVLGGIEGIALSAILGFATVALLYLVTEELLVEAHEGPEPAHATALFFVGFLALLLVHMAA